MKKNNLTITNMENALIEKFCTDCDDLGPDKCGIDCEVSTAISAMWKALRIQREKKHAKTNTLLRTG